MPTRLRRFQISLPETLEDILTKDAEASSRPVGSHVVHILKLYYQERKQAADLFAIPQLREVGRAHVPVFETPLLPQAAPVSKPHASEHQGKN